VLGDPVVQVGGGDRARDVRVVQAVMVRAGSAQAPQAGPASAPARERNLPVMVWVHGGSLLTGESNDYNPAALVRGGVIVVTISYRLGALGFLADASGGCSSARTSSTAPRR
jgi:acetyl esterase/lipase